MKRPKTSSERGAVLLHVAIALMVLIAVNTFVVDYGVMWVGRRQAQNAADAGALAGAVAMAFDPDGMIDRTETGPARLAARQMALANAVWGEAPDVNIATDVFFTDQPTAECLDSEGNAQCIRVDVYRNQERDNSLPAFFGVIAGLTEQGVRATATARVAVANASECLKPWAIPDKWLDAHDVIAPTLPLNTWTEDDEFDTHTKQGNDWFPLVPPDEYTKPTASGPGTGFTLAADRGRQIILKEGGPSTSISPGVYYPIRLPTLNGPSAGGSDYEENIASCNGLPVEIGDTVESENGNMIGPTKHGVQELIALDPNAEWDADSMSVVGSCAQAATPCGPQSPRIVAIPVFDTATYYSTKRQGLPVFTVVNILGFFIDDMQGNNVVGYLTKAPGLSLGNSSITAASSFLSQIQLVR